MLHNYEHELKELEMELEKFAELADECLNELIDQYPEFFKEEI